jgi:hypothetical protein
MLSDQKARRTRTSSIMTVRLMMHEYATRYLPKRLARISFVGLVESMRPSNGGQVRDGFEVKDKDVVRHECSFEDSANHRSALRQQKSEVDYVHKVDHLIPPG